MIPRVPLCQSIGEYHLDMRRQDIQYERDWYLSIAKQHFKTLNFTTREQAMYYCLFLWAVASYELGEIS